MTKESGIARPRWFDPVVAPDGRRLTLGNWLLTTVVPALFVAHLLTWLGGSLFGNVLMPWLNIHDKDAIIILIVYVAPSTSVFGLAIAFYVRLLLGDIYRKIYSLLPLFIFTIAQTIFYLFFSGARRVDEIVKWDPDRTITWIFIISSNILILLTVSHGIREYSIFRVRRYIHITFGSACFLFGIAASLLLVALSGSDAAFIAISVAIYISAVLVAVLAVWLSFARVDGPKELQPATGPKG